MKTYTRETPTNSEILKFFLLIFFFSISISLAYHVIFRFSSFSRAPYQGFIAYIIGAYVSYKLFFKLPKNIKILPRLILGKIICFALIYGLSIFLKFDINNSIKSHFNNYTLETLTGTLDDGEGNSKYYEQHLVMYPINKPYSNKIENDIPIEFEKINRHSITKGYGLIEGYEPMNMSISLIDKYLLSGFEYFFEIFISNWLSILLPVFLLKFIPKKAFEPQS